MTKPKRLPEAERLKVHAAFGLRHWRGMLICLISLEESIRRRRLRTPKGTLAYARKIIDESLKLPLGDDPPADP